jgi:Tfp pilus assembly protein PilN
MSELNLIPHHIKQSRLKKAKLTQLILAILLFIAVLTSVVVYQYVRLNKLRTEEAVLKVQMDKSGNEKVQNEVLKKEAAALKGFIDKVDSIKDNETKSYAVIKNLEKYLPQDIVIKNLNFAAGSLSATAVSKNYNSINELLANLQESEEYSGSSIADISFNSEAGEYSFSLNIIVIKGENK